MHEVECIGKMFYKKPINGQTFVPNVTKLLIQDLKKNLKGDKEPSIKSGFEMLIFWN